MNDQFCRMSDHSQEELIGRSPWDLVPPEISTRLKDWYKRRHMGESLPTHYEAAGVRKDGTVVPLELSIVTMPWQGKIATVLYLRDITERKRAEEALREGEERFRGIIENAPFGYYRVGKDELWQYVNPVWERMHGFSLEEVVGKSFEITQTEDAVGKARENVQRSLAGETITGEFSRLTRNGSIEYHSFNIQPVKHGNEIVAIEGFINDITERKRAEEALKESENRYRNLIESALDIIYTFSPDGIITSLNPAFETITGWKIKDWIGKSFTDLIHPEELSPAMKLIQESIAGKEHPRNEFRLLTKTGDYVPLDFNANPLLKDGKLIG
ncbi:MAG: PAS domain-containing protein, partial [candidate division Zixibacteria bacterium]|nr:PAS domain-containing protein [candidate division Zixibacteria bacterium]